MTLPGMAESNRPASDLVVEAADSHAASALFLEALHRYAAAVSAKDVDAFVALYDHDVRVFDLWGGWTLQGIDAWRQMAREWFASLGSERVRVTVQDAQAVREGALLVGHAVLTYTALSAGGQTLRSLDNRITLALRRSAGGWKVLHEHTSVPVDHATLKARLQRDPLSMV